GQLVTVGNYGFSDAAASRYPRPVDTTSHNGRAIVERRIIHVPDTIAEPSQIVLEDLAQQRPLTSRSQLSVPMMRGDTPIGVVVVARHVPGPFAEAHIDLLKTFADQAAIASGNAWLFKELQEKNHALTEAHAQVTESLEQQTATSEILRVISGSPTNLEPVFNSIAQSAAKLCEAYDCEIYRVDDDGLRLVAHYGPSPSGPVGQFVVPLVRGTIGGRSALERRTIHVHDLRAAADEYPEGYALAAGREHRTQLRVPLLRKGAALGVIGVRRSEVRPFTESQVVLLQTFADQAVIAVENVRLFTELQ